MPPAVRGEIGGTVEDLLALGTPVLHVHYHGTSKGKREKSLSQDFWSKILLEEVRREKKNVMRMVVIDALNGRRDERYR